jgi:hypothetical protein
LLGLVCLFKLKAYVVSSFQVTKEGGRECCPTPPLYILMLCKHNLCWLFWYLNETIVLSPFIVLVINQSLFSSYSHTCVYINGHLTSGIIRLIEIEVLFLVLTWDFGCSYLIILLFLCFFHSNLEAWTSFKVDIVIRSLVFA